MILFQLVTGLIAVLCLAGFVYALRNANDTLHPLAYLMPMVFFAYVAAPWELLARGLLQQSGIPLQELALVQTVDLLIAGAMVAGVVSGGKDRRRRRAAAFVPDLKPSQRLRIVWISCALGTVAVVAFSYGVENVGGFSSAYSEVKGGGTASSGYVRDAVMLAVPAIGLFAVATAAARRAVHYWVFSAAIVGPLLLHGLLSGRRGPTFLAIATAMFGWYLSRRRKPRAVTLLAGGFAITVILLLLVTFRSEFRLGSALAVSPGDTLKSMFSEFVEERTAGLERNLGGVEFVFGANVIRSYLAEGNYFWGRRVATVLFIRPIPKELWPTKYEDVGMGAYITNVGLTLKQDLLLDATLGAAPGFVADLFAEFSWGGLLAAYFLGWVYGRAWAGARREGGFWVVLYTILGALSLYFVAQTLEAILFRLTFMTAAALLAWRLAGLALSGPVEHQGLAVRRVG